MSDAKPEIWFYHLERSTLDQVLPGLLEKTLQRGWRALVRGAVAHRLGEQYRAQRAHGTLAEGPGAGADYYLFDLTFFADLSGQATLRGSINVGGDPD